MNRLMGFEEVWRSIRPMRRFEERAARQSTVFDATGGRLEAHADATVFARQRFYAWSLEQAALLRAGRVGEADLSVIAEEIESMGKTEKRELISRLTVLLLHF